jgi:PPOX class probable F420-dependent enzyme
VIPSEYHDLLDAPNTAVLVTLDPAGMPNASPVWFRFTGGAVEISTTKDRAKYRNVVRDPRVAFTVVDPAKGLRYLELRGTVGITDDPDGELRDAIAVKHGYASGASFDPPGAERVRLTILPTRVIAH